MNRWPYSTTKSDEKDVLTDRPMMTVLVLGPVLLVCGSVFAQSPRTHTLTYNPEKRSWAEEAPPQAGTAEGDLYAVRALIKEGRYRRALSAVKRLIKKYGEDDASNPGALIAKAEALIGRHQYYKAHLVLQAFLSRHGGGPLTGEALRLEHVIAEIFLSGVKRKLLGLRVLSGRALADSILDEIATDYPDMRIAELARKTKADHLFKDGDYALAELEYEELTRKFPRSRYGRFALRRSAESALASFGGVPYDDAPLIEAVERYHEYRQRYPSDAQRTQVRLVLDRITELQAEKEFSIGAYYERTDHLTSAIFYYQRVRREWPDSIAAAKASRRLELLGLGERVGLNEASSPTRAGPHGPKP